MRDAWSGRVGDGGIDGGGGADGPWSDRDPGAGEGGGDAGAGPPVAGGCAATERNLREAGYDGFAGLYMVPDGERFASAADFKAPSRAAIEQAGYTIIANVGDQPSDLACGHAQREFLLANPF